MPKGVPSAGPENGTPTGSSGRVGREERAQERHGDDGDEENAPDQPGRRAHESERGDVHTCVLSFGTSRTTRRSATMLIRM